ncbi:MAG: MBL fold metallo-hydrolase [Candidatus Hodarchaeota archaeon]
MTSIDKGIDEIQGVYRYKGPVPVNLKFVCVYMFKVDGQTVMFDAGFSYPTWGRSFFTFLRDNPSFKKVDFCIVSHFHVDHVGYIKRLKRKYPDMQLLMHEFTRDIIKWHTDPANSKVITEKAKKVSCNAMEYGLDPLNAKKIGQYLVNLPKMVHFQEPDRILHDGEEISIGSRLFEFVWTPGHTIDHMCMFDKDKKYLFSGDHILSQITPHIGTFDVSPDFNKDVDFSDPLKLYLESLEKLGKLNPTITFPSHQDIIYNMDERIMEIKLHHEERLNAISNLIRDNPMSPLKIANIHFGENLDEMNHLLALNEVASHLIFLENQGKIKRMKKDGKYLFSS